MINKKIEERIVSERKRKISEKQKTLINRYNELYSIEDSVQIKIFGVLAEEFQYKNAETVKIVMHRLKHKFPNNFLRRK